MDAAIDEVAFLANSTNRVEVLEVLATAPQTRHDLRERTESSRVTLGRILRELETRNWVERRGQTYRLTPLGEWVCEEFENVMAELRDERRLREALQWFPSELLTFDVRRLRDAEVILLDGADPTALERRILEFHRSGEWIRGFGHGGSPRAVENHWELAMQEDARIEMVLTPATFEAVRDDPPSVRRIRELVELDHVSYLVYEDVPLSVGIVDDTVGITLADERGIPQGGMTTDDETVYEWAVDCFETYREKARPFDPETFFE